MNAAAVYHMPERPVDWNPKADWAAFNAAMVRIRRAVRLRRHDDAAAAARRILPLIGERRIRPNVLRERLRGVMEESLLPQFGLGARLQDWLYKHATDPFCDDEPPAECKATAAILLQGEKFTAQIDAAETTLIEAGLGLYQRAGQIRPGFVYRRRRRKRGASGVGGE